MRTIKIDGYGAVTRELIEKAAAAKLPRTLNLSTPLSDAKPLLASMTDQNISQNRRVRMPHDAEALRAGLWLLFDYMEESHDISQKLATPSGSFWHGILHRREPDASNAKYWFARVGEHPIFAELLRDAQELAANSSLSHALSEVKQWNASWFIDQCCGHPDSATEQILLEIQRREWGLLFAYNFSKAFA